MAAAACCAGEEDLPRVPMGRKKRFEHIESPGHLVSTLSARAPALHDVDGEGAEPFGPGTF